MNKTEQNYNRTKLSNGLVIVSDYVANIGSFSAGICVNAGSRNDYKSKEGIAHFMEHSAFRHTIHRSSKQIANSFENLGAYSNAWTTKDATCYYARAISGHFAKIFDLLSDISQNTIFVDKEISREKSVILEEIKSYEDDPEEYIFDLIDTLVFSGGSMSHPIVGSQESVTGIEINDLESFKNDFYRVDNMIIAVSGNIEHDRIVDLASEFFVKNDNISVKNDNISVKSDNISVKSDNISVKSDKKMDKIINSSDLVLDKDELVTKNSISKELIIHKPIQQSHIILGKLSSGYSIPSERYKLAVANTIFGDGMSSRLYQGLRERHGLAYSIYSSIQNYIDCGQINIYMATDDVNIERGVDLVYKEMVKLTKDKPITKNELNRAKEQLKTGTIIELESMSSRMQNLIKQELTLCGYNESIKDIISNIENVSIDDVISISEKYFNVDNWCKCVLMPSD